MEKIDYNINGDTTIAQAARRLRYVPMAYQRFLMMPLFWVAEGVGAYGATDGRSIFVNPRGKQKIEHTSDPVGYFAFFLLHEVLHALLNHALRLLKLENHERANKAADYVINAIIHATNKKVEREHGFTPFPMIEGVLYDPNISHRKDSNGEPKGKPYSAEEVYQNLGIQELMDQKNQEPQPEPSEGDDGDGESDGSISGDSANDDSENDDSDDGADANSNAKGKSDSEILSDFVGTGSDDLAEPSLEEGESVQDFESELDKINHTIDIQAHANANHGIHGAGATVEVKEAMDNKTDMVDFEDLLEEMLKTNYEEGWNKPFNIQMYKSSGIACRGRAGKSSGELAFLVDVSGSNVAHVSDMVARTQDAFDSVDPEVIHLVPFSHKIWTPIEIQSGDKLPKEIEGSGGTDIAKALDWVADELPDVDAIVVLTDGYDNWDKINRAEPETQVVWLNYGRYYGDYGRAYSFGEDVNINLK